MEYETDWKQYVIELTEHPAAVSDRTDASFFPPVSEERLRQWEKENKARLPDRMRNFLQTSDGLEARVGRIWPILPLSAWERIDLPCAFSDPFLRFGRTETHRYLVSLGHSPSIYRHEEFGGEAEFFAQSLDDYLARIFQGRE